VIAANPDIIVASWCGRRVDVEAIRGRSGFGAIRAVKDGEIHAVDSDWLLQPGPELVAGARELRRIFADWRARACIPTDPHPP
jgi:iron complex transport system substrate-binding protein